MWCSSGCDVMGRSSSPDCDQWLDFGYLRGKENAKRYSACAALKRMALGRDIKVLVVLVDASAASYVVKRETLLLDQLPPRPPRTPHRYAILCYLIPSV
jgi:hypothetical protein